MIPKIKVNVGQGLPPVEVQQVIDTDLLTSNKTVVGAINELLSTVENLEITGGSLPNGALLETITPEMVSQWNAAQANTIEKIFVNNAEISIIDKSVSLTVPTKPSDIGAASEVHNHDGVYLKSNEMIPAALLPSYVDDVIEVAKFEELPNPGESGKIYVVTSTNKTYRWSGTQYASLNAGVVIGETAESAFRGDYGKVAYEHAISRHAPTSAQENVIEKVKIAGVDMPISDKTIDIAIASGKNHGVVKSSSGANRVTVEGDGDMRIDVVSTSSLKVPIGEALILSGGTSIGFDDSYTTRINNIGYESIRDAVNAANYGDVIVMDKNIDLGTLDTGNLVFNAENITLNTNHATLTANGSNGVIEVTGGSTTITGNGTVAARLGSDNYSMAVWANGGSVVIEGGTYKNTTDGSDRGTDLIYASGNAKIEITGGTFIAAKPEWTLNCKDADYKAGKANIIVKGGRFYMFDPANNNTEGVGTNYVADGYKSIKDGDYYIVKPV